MAVFLDDHSGTGADAEPVRHARRYYWHALLHLTGHLLGLAGLLLIDPFVVL